MIAEVLTHLGGDKYIVKASNGPRYIVGCRDKLDRSKLKAGCRVTLDQTTLTIMHSLPREVDPSVYQMLSEDPGSVSYSSVGGLHEQIRELREVIELPLTNPELFKRVGIKPPKGVLLYGPPGTGKTLLARALACNMNATFIKVVASAIVDKYIGESARMIREMFGYARDHAPTVIFMDEIDAIGARRDSGASSSDREIQRTLMELLNQLDGFEGAGQVKVVMATNRPDILDPALLRPGRLDRKIEIPLPNDAGRMDILKIHALPMAKKGDVDWEAVVKLSDGFNGADMRNITTEAGMMAIRADRDYVVEEDFLKAVRKIRASWGGGRARTAARFFARSSHTRRTALTLHSTSPPLFPTAHRRVCRGNKVLGEQDGLLQGVVRAPSTPAPPALFPSRSCVLCSRGKPPMYFFASRVTEK